MNSTGPSNCTLRNASLELSSLKYIKPDVIIAGKTTVAVNLDLDSQASSLVDEMLDEDSVDDDTKHRMRFEDLLRRAQEEDLTSIEDTNCIYRAGYDKQGRSVIVFIGKWFRHSQINLEKALLYLVRTVDPIVDQDYVVVYFHTRTSRDNIPSYWWIKHVYNTVTYNYKKNLKAFYVVHPTLWTKMTCWWFSTFMAPAIKNKIHNLNALTDLSSIVNEQDLGIPMFITEQDMVLNGLRYYQP